MKLFLLMKSAWPRVQFQMPVRQRNLRPYVIGATRTVRGRLIGAHAPNR